MRSGTLTIMLLVNLICCKLSYGQQLLNDVRELSSDKYKGRKTGTAGNKLAADYIVSRFRAIGLKPLNNSFTHPFSVKNASGKIVKGTNLLAVIPGKKEDIIVISAHYDHVGVINGKIYNGADDNASGIGGLLSIAKYFKTNPPDHTLLIAAFDAEETGLLGAKAFVGKPPVAIGKIKLDINMDMISRSDKGEIYASGTYHYPQLKKYLISSNPEVKLLLGHDNPKEGSDDWTSQSDHYAFHSKKIPFIYFGVEDHEDYHKSTDDFEKIDKDFYTGVVGMITEVIKNIDKGLSIQSLFKDKKIMGN